MVVIYSEKQLIGSGGEGWRRSFYP